MLGHPGLGTFFALTRKWKKNKATAVSIYEKETQEALPHPRRAKSITEEDMSDC